MIIGLEGGVCSGKTTFGKCLNKINKDNLFLPEYESFISKYEETILDSILDNTEKYAMYFEIEKNRKVYATLNNYKNLILDRTFFSILAYEYIRNNLVGIDNVIKNINKCEVLMPDIIYFLSVEQQVRIERYKRRGQPLPEFYTSEDFNKKMYMFFNNIVSRFVKVKFLDTSKFLKDW